MYTVECRFHGEATGKRVLDPSERGKEAHSWDTPHLDCIFYPFAIFPSHPDRPMDETESDPDLRVDDVIVGSAPLIPKSNFTQFVKSEFSPAYKAPATSFTVSAHLGSRADLPSHNEWGFYV